MSTKQGRYSNCVVCQTLNDYQGVMWVRDEVHGEIPAAESDLRIVGEPFIHKDTYSSDSRYTLLKQCPECGTFYRCRLDYEYLAGGSEDEYTVTRLADSDGIEEAKQVFETLKNRTPALDEKELNKAERKTFNYKF